LSARNKHKPNRANPVSIGRIRECITELLIEAIKFVAPGRVEETARGLLPRMPPDGSRSSRELLAAADTIAMAMDLALFTPSASGQTAFDRLARQRRGSSAAEAAGLDVLRRSAFRLLRIEAAGAGSASLRDLVTGETLRVADVAIGAGLAGIALVGRLAPLGDGRHIFISGITPLDEDGLAVAQGFVRPGAHGLPPRCAEAVYRHVLRHGTRDIPGLNRPLGGEHADEPDEISELDRIARRWAEQGAPRDPADIRSVRGESNLDAVLDMIASAVNTRAHGLGTLSAAYAEILGVQLAAVRRRQTAGSGSLGLDGIAAAVAAMVAAGALPPGAGDVLAEARRRLGASVSNSGGRDADLDRLIGRIQALRAKTVDQGCTEPEALAAAEKVAEFLDRYGLSLSELDLQRQTCEGAAVETSRKRVGPVDDCVPAIAAFFDCRVWGEKGTGGTLRYVFFGLPADVAAARYLYDLVELAFETETAMFRVGPTYADMPSGLRRTASNSFGIGLARGIAAKLDTLRKTREGALRGAAGRDLVMAKADLVEAELARLGLHLRARKGPAGRRILRDAYAEGHEAGLGFEYLPGVGHG